MPPSRFGPTLAGALAAPLLLATSAAAQSLSVVRIADETAPFTPLGSVPALSDGQVALTALESATGLETVVLAPAHGQGPLTALLREGDAAPQAPGEVFFMFWNPALDHGTVYVPAGVDFPWVATTSYDGIYAVAATTPVAHLGIGGLPHATDGAGVAFLRGTYPYWMPVTGGSEKLLLVKFQGMPGGGTYIHSDFLETPALHAGVASASARCSITGGTGYGTYTIDAATGAVELVANWNSVVPNSSETFTYCGASDLDDREVVFHGISKNHSGLFKAPLHALGAGPIEALVQKGDPAPGGGTFADIDGIFAWQDGTLAFKAWVGSTVGLYLLHDGVIRTVADGATLLGGRKVGDLRFSHRSFDGRQLAFRVTFADGAMGYGIFVATFDPTDNSGSPGSGGHVPNLTLSGLPMPGETVTLSLRAGLGGATALLLFGDDFVDLPMGRSGARLHAAPLLPDVLTLVLGGSGPGNGDFDLTETIPPTLTGLRLVTQALLLDPGASGGFCASNAVLALDG